MSTVLYKYFSFERITFFDNLLVRFTQPSAFNDPFEFLPVEKFTSDFEKIDISNNKPEFHRIDEKTQQLISIRASIQISSMIQNFLVGTHDRLGVFCLSENWDNILMWSHYAGNHNGFVVGFDINHSFFKDFEFPLKPIIYSSNRPDFSVSDFERNVIYTKSDIWRYEKEWRICKDSSKSYKTIDSKIHLFKIPEDAIQSIFIGCKVSEEETNLIKAKLKEWNSPPNLYQVHLHPKRYDIVAVQFEPSEL